MLLNSLFLGIIRTICVCAMEFSFKMFSTFVFFLCIGFCAAIPVWEGADCLLRNGAIGICRGVATCPPVKNNQGHIFGTPSARIICAVENKKEIICCPRSDEEKADDEVTEKIVVPTVPIKRRKPPINVENRVAARECESIKKRVPISVGNNIIKGDDAGEGEFPHMAALGYIINNQLQFDCGGSLISDTFIVTAGHCIINNQDVRPHMVRMGIVKIDEVFEEDDTDYNVQEIILHPTYTSRSKYNDIALIKLDRPVKFTIYKSPACIYLKSNNPRSSLTVAGWGLTNPKNINSRSKKLLKALLVPLSNALCKDEYSSYRRADLAQGITNEQMCAIDQDRDRNGDELKRDTCSGDSGGPLQTQENGHVSIVGITSFSNSECGSGGATVYTRLSEYLDWIESVVWPET